MSAVTVDHGLVLAFLLFLIGAVGLVIRRNMLFMLICLEVMLNAVALAFIIAGSAWHQAEGQVMYVFIITLAAAETTIGLALLIQLHKRCRTLNIDALSRMKG